MLDSTLISVRPPGGRFLTGQGGVLLATGRDGFATGEDDGLFAGGVKVLSRLRWLVDGRAPVPATLSAIEQNTWMGYYAASSVELRLSRFAGPGLHEDADVVNYGPERATVQLSVELEADGPADWRAAGDEWELSFQGVAAAVFSRCPPPRREERTVSFLMTLDPGERGHVCLDVVARVAGADPSRCGRCGSYERPRSPGDQARADFLRAATGFSTRGSASLGPAVSDALERGKKDLAALRLRDPGGPGALAASRQAVLAGPELVAAALAAAGELRTALAARDHAAALLELWRWTGDQELVGRFVVPGLEAVAWLDRHGDADAPSEEQGFVYQANQQLADVLWWLGRRGESKRLRRAARELKKRFNDAHWLQHELVGSAAGLCLASAIVDDAFVIRAADRLMAPDLFSGWGIRTSSTRLPGYNPSRDGQGAVRSAEQGDFALAFFRYGLHEHLERLARGQCEAAAMFEHRRLPALFSGHSSSELPFPSLTPEPSDARSWSASTLFSVLQSLLGIQAYASLDLLLVDPYLPAWLPEITLAGLRVGKSRLTIHFRRKPGGGSDYRVLSKHGRVRVVRQPCPSSVTSGVLERVGDLVMSLSPAH